MMKQLTILTNQRNHSIPINDAQTLIELSESLNNEIEWEPCAHTVSLINHRQASIYRIRFDIHPYIHRMNRKVYVILTPHQAVSITVNCMFVTR